MRWIGKDLDEGVALILEGMALSPIFFDSRKGNWHIINGYGFSGRSRHIKLWASQYQWTSYSVRFPPTPSCFSLPSLISPVIFPSFFPLLHNLYPWIFVALCKLKGKTTIGSVVHSLLNESKGGGLFSPMPMYYISMAWKWEGGLSMMLFASLASANFHSPDSTVA